MTGGLPPWDTGWDAGFSAETRLACLDCGGLYDPAGGDAARGVPPGTPFARLPERWTCPGCDAPPHRFAPTGTGAADGTGRLDALIAAYRHIAQTDMRNVAVANPALPVEAVGFRPFGNGRIGCVVAPWFLNAVLLPDDPGRWAERRDGDALRLILPSGDYRFTMARMGALGVVAVIPLASDMGLFSGPEDARAAAALALDTLMRTPPSATPAPNATPPAKPAVSRRALFGRKPS